MNGCDCFVMIKKNTVKKRRESVRCRNRATQQEETETNESKDFFLHDNMMMMMMMMNEGSPWREKDEHAMMMHENI